MTNKELLDKIRDEILHLKMKELQRTNGINTGADVYLSSYAVLSILSNALTEESEDERIRRALVEYFGPKVQLDFVRGVPIQKIRDWLEKQKENPKNADSIPADCALNAKCEDRWHKTANYLPDDGRDVLAKDALGNYLLASFDGAQWFVSVYDGEDHPVLHTPPILEWCEIPSEKQKEQKPAEWSEEDEKKIHFLSRLIEFQVKDGEYCFGEGSCAISKQEAIEMLQSLRPQSKAGLTLLDKNIINAAVAFVEQNDHFNCWGGIDKHTVLKALRSLRPSWKPSEEQMEALRKALTPGSVFDCDILNELYIQLKKLK